MPIVWEHLNSKSKNYLKIGFVIIIITMQRKIIIEGKYSMWFINNTTLIKN